MLTIDRFRIVILSVLAMGEKRLLSLVVAVRKQLQRNEIYRGDLTSAVKTTLRRLVANGEVREVDGIYSLGRTVHLAADRD